MNGEEPEISRELDMIIGLSQRSGCFGELDNALSAQGTSMT